MLNSLLICLSLIFAFSICEITIRYLRPDLRNIVYNKYKTDRFRIHKNLPLQSCSRRHPDTGRIHPVIHNSLGLRQHREFDKIKNPNVVRIGFFGDSYTENLRMAVQYSFTEPLDYLLNRTGKKYEVLNMGTDGYGTDQSYLAYLDGAQNYDLDIVFYVFYENDLIEIMANDLCYINKNGKLSFRSYNDNLIYGLLRRFYATYLIIEAYKPFQKVLYWDTRMNYRNYHYTNRKLLEKSYEYILLEGDNINSKLSKSFSIFSSLLRKWETEADKRNQLFFVALLPISTPGLNMRVKTVLQRIGIGYVDLLPYFTEKNDFNTLTQTNIDSDQAVLETFLSNIKSYLKNHEKSDLPTHKSQIVTRKIRSLFGFIENHPNKKLMIALINSINQNKNKKITPGLIHFLENENEERIKWLLDSALMIGQINSQYYFINDGHWNEEGNKIATVCLIKFLANTLNLAGIDDQFISHGLNEYYRSFEPKAVSDSWIGDGPVPLAIKQSIRQKYLYLEQHARPLNDGHL